MSDLPLNEIIDKIRSLFTGQETVPLHAPILGQREHDLVNECLKSTFVSSVGQFVDRFEIQIADYTRAKFCVAVQSGTSALQLALLAVGVKLGDEVLTQSLSFIATANSIKYCGAEPVFLDTCRNAPTLDPAQLEEFLVNHTTRDSKGSVTNKTSGKRIAAIVPMHTLGLVSDMKSICQIAEKYGIPVVEDAAESLGSWKHGVHSGLFGEVGALSFNGNKIITTGGGGAIITNNKKVADHIKHVSKTAKMPHAYEFFHDEIGFNFRLPNINAALGVAQMERLSSNLVSKRELALSYQSIFKNFGVPVLAEADDEKSNYWLNAIILSDFEEREAFLLKAHQSKVLARPFWLPIHRQNPYSRAQKFGELDNTNKFYDTVVTLPSSARV